MTAVELLTCLRALDITLRLNDEQLRIDAPKGVLTPELRAHITARKADLVALLRTAAVSSGVDRVIPRMPRDGELPLSHGQQRLWFLDQMDPGSTAYVMPSATRLRGDLDIAALQAALTAIVDRHESLRTVFRAHDGVPSQVIRPPSPVALPVVDLRSLPSAVRLDEALRCAAADARAPFDLEVGPLLRAQLLRLDECDFVLLVAFHHIVFDAWSAAVFMRELGVCYRAGRGESSEKLADLPLQFADYAAWRRRSLDAGGREAQLAYWMKQLQGERPSLDLPMDRPRRGSTRTGASAALEMSPESTAGLAALCRDAGVTSAMALLAIFQLLMHRLTGEADILVGTPVAGRARPETESMIGFFINTVVMRALIAPSMTFRDLLAQVREAALGAFAHQDLPFEDLVSALDPHRDLSRTPLFQVFFNHLTVEMPVLELPGVAVEPFGSPVVESKFDLTLYAYAVRDRLQLVASYDSELFDPPRIGELLEQYRGLLDQVAAEPNRGVGEYSLVTPGAARVLPAGGAPLVTVAENSAATLVLSGLGEYGSRTALRGEAGDWSYAELDARADRLARKLLRSGVRRGDIVAVYAARDPALVCALLGVLRAGAAFAVLDPAYPDFGLAERWQAAAPQALLTIGAVPPEGGALATAVAASNPSCRLDVARAVIDDAAMNSDSVLPQVQSDDLAYVAFTSGTTGGVKAIAGTHGPVAHFLDWQRREFDLRAEDRFTLLSGLAHDPLLRDVFAPLWCGATLCVPNTSSWGDPGELATWLCSVQPTVVHLTPAMAQFLLIELAPAGRDAPPPLPSWRLAFFGGDILAGDTVAELRRLAPQATCVNFYGATETPQAMGYHVVRHGSDTLRARIPLGRGIEGVELLVLNSNTNLAGVGELGEIVVRTPYLALGYRGDPALTAQRFTINPLTGVAGDRVYYTGDLGRYLPDGAVEFVGRRDGQLKIRGFRVEVGEVEAALRNGCGVAQTAVVLSAEGAEEPRLVAYVVKDSEQPFDAAALKRALQKQLPEHAIPTTYVSLDKLPLTPNGKVDRRALPAPDMLIEGQRYEPPATATEVLVANIYAQLLGRDRVGRNDSFFELGGHSLLGARAVARIRAEVGAALPLRALFESPTPAALAARIDRAKGESAAESLPPLTRRAAGDAPLSFAQQRLWFIDQLEPESAAYLMTGAIALEGELDVTALQGALGEIVTRHEVLRTVLKTDPGGAPYQEIRAASPLRLSIEDLSGLPEEQRTAEVRRRAAAAAREPMDLAEGPLLRLKLLRESERRHVLVLAVHHSVFDGWSGGVLVRELAALYEANRAGNATPLAELPVQYADYAVWQRQWLQGEALERQLSFWRERLAGAAPSLELPTDRPRPPLITYRGARWSCVLPTALHQSLAALSRREGVTLFMTLLAAFKVVLARYSGQQDVVIGSPVANRGLPELEGMIGLFVNTLVLRSQLDPKSSFRELLGQVRETCLGAYAHQDLPFERLVEELKPPRDTSRNPLFQVMFALQNMELPALELPGLAIAPLDFDRQAAQVDLTLYMHESAAGLHATFEYSTDLFDRGTIERLGGHLRTLLEAAAARPETAVAALPLLDAAERAQVLQSFNATEQPYARERTVIDMFAAQVATRSQRPALTFGASTLTYAELDMGSSGLAAHLQSLGIGPGSIVGVCLERSPQIVLAVLGIWKTGAAYLPLDPGFPRERLRYMLEDSGAALLVTEDGIDLEVPSAVARVDINRLPEMRVAAPTPRLDPAGRAYVIYTSGSTGRPKGVEVGHAALTNFLSTMGSAPGITAKDSLAAVTTISFDISLLELVLPLTVGARVLLVDKDTVADGHRLKAMLESSQATVMQATPSLWRVLLAAGWTPRGDFKALCGGEPFPPDLAESLATHCREVWNMYGPTETTVWSTCERIANPAAPISIGRPIANTQIYVLDRAGQPVPPIVPGELYIGGDGVALGYLNRPDLTAERFVSNPFVTTPGARMYRTGDQGRWLADGRLQHLGRLDNQVKIRGFRIELGEIEAVLRGHPSVKEAAVTVWSAGVGDQRIAAYVVARNGEIAVAELRKHLRGSLPDYMIPQHFIELDMLPLTPNGKVDRKALPAPLHNTRTAPVERDPPRGPTEEMIAAVWREVIGIKEVSRADNFFDIGGHSLLAVKAIALLEARSGWRAAPRLFILENLQEIAVRCDRERPPPANTQKARGLLTRLKGLLVGANEY
jgi:amino acid adenylation domain-containing protein